MSLPDDLLRRIFQVEGLPPEVLRVCKRFREAIHAGARSVVLNRSFDGDVDDVHVAIMARCPALRCVDASALGEEARPWPLADVTQLTTVTVTHVWRADDLPPALQKVHVRCARSPLLILPSSAWRQTAALVAALRARPCKVEVDSAWCRSEESLAALASLPPGDRVCLRQLRVLAALLSDDQSLPALYNVRDLHLDIDTGPQDLTDYEACCVPSLKRLRLGCYTLQSLAGLPTSQLTGLSKLELSRPAACAVITLRHISGLSSLAELALDKCDSLVTLGLPAGLTRLTRVEILVAPRLKKLDWDGIECAQLRCLKLVAVPRLNFAVELSRLRGIDHIRCDSERGDRVLPFPSGLHDLGQASRPHTIHFVCSSHKPPPLPRHLDLCYVQHADLTNCVDDRARVTALDAFSCDRLTSLKGLQRYDTLSGVDICQCSTLRSLGALRAASGLTSLQISGCHPHVTLQGLQCCTRLRELSIDSTPVADSGLPVHWPGLRRVALSRGNGRGPGFSSLDAFSLASQLTALELRGFTGLTSIRGLQGAQSLREVCIDGCSALASLAPLSHLPQLTRVQLACSGAVLQGIEGVARLAVLVLSEVTSLQALPALTALRRLELRFCPLTSIAGVERLPQLTSLHLSHCVALTSLRPVRGVQHMAELVIDSCTRLRTLADLADADNLALSAADITVKLCLKTSSSVQGLPLHHDYDMEYGSVYDSEEDYVWPRVYDSEEDDGPVDDGNS